VLYLACCACLTHASVNNSKKQLLVCTLASWRAVFTVSSLQCTLDQYLSSTRCSVLILLLLLLLPLLVAAAVTKCRGELACESVLRNVLGSLTALAARSERLTVAVCNAFHAALLRLSAAATSGPLDYALQQRAALFFYTYEDVCNSDCSNINGCMDYHVCTP
jgi:succinate-acetate transporter protein